MTAHLYSSLIKKSEEISNLLQSIMIILLVKNEFAWESKSNRTLDSDEIKILLNSNSSNLKIYLFIQKSKMMKELIFTFWEM